MYIVVSMILVFLHLAIVGQYEDFPNKKKVT